MGFTFAKWLGEAQDCYVSVCVSGMACREKQKIACKKSEKVPEVACKKISTAPGSRTNCKWKKIIFREQWKMALKYGKKAEKEKLAKNC